MKKLVLVLSLGLFLFDASSALAARLLVLNKDDATLMVIDPESGAVQGSVATGFQPHEVAASTDGKLAFVTNYGNPQQPGHTLSIIDLVTLKERRLDVAPLSRPHGAVFVNGKLYFTAEGSQKIARYDVATDKIDWEFATGQDKTHMVLPMKGEKLLFTSNIGSNSMSAIAQGRDGKWTQTVIPVGRGPEGFDLSPDGKTLWVAHSGDGGVSIIDVATNKVLKTLPIGTKRSNRLKLTADGKLALVSDLQAGDLVVIDAVQRQVLKHLALGRMPAGILIPPIAGRAYVAINGDSHVAVIDTVNLQVVKLLSTGGGPDGMAWVR